jgi:hypothetical protein
VSKSGSKIPEVTEKSLCKPKMKPDQETEEEGFKYAEQ